MLILALETSSVLGSVALARDDEIVGTLSLREGQKTAQSLVPLIQQLLGAAACDVHAVQLVAVTQGPGSFTGLRVGVTTAKSLAYAIGSEVIGVNTLEVIASQAPSCESAVSAIIDAQRGELFASDFVRGAGTDISSTTTTQIVSRATWLAQLAPGTCVIGPGLKRAASELPPQVTAAAVELWQPTATSVARLAARQYAAGKRDNLWGLVPNYFRKSAAEEKAERAV